MTATKIPILFEKDADLALIRARTAAIIGFGNQGRAQAGNLKDRGVRVIVGLRADSRSRALAAAEGFEVDDIEAAVSHADVVMNLLPDESQAEIHARSIAPHLRAGQALGYAAGFNIHFRQIVPPEAVDVILIAPVGPGHLLRSRFDAGKGIPCMIAVQQDATGHARALALSYAAAIGAGRAGILETTFKDECETDLFGEQAVIVGGVSRLITAGFETMVEAGYPEELAYFECAHQMKLLVDMIHDRGIAGMREGISNTARYGDLTRGPRVIDESVKARMKEVLGEVQSGEFAKEWILEHRSGGARLSLLTETQRQHPIEGVGARLRGLTKE